jgi:hypothetical protein
MVTWAWLKCFVEIRIIHDLYAGLPHNETEEAVKNGRQSSSS